MEPTKSCKTVKAQQTKMNESGCWCWCWKAGLEKGKGARQRAVQCVTSAAPTHKTQKALSKSVGFHTTPTTACRSPLVHFLVVPLTPPFLRFHCPPPQPVFCSIPTESRRVAVCFAADLNLI